MNKLLLFELVGRCNTYSPARRRDSEMIDQTTDYATAIGSTKQRR